MISFFLSYEVVLNTYSGFPDMGTQRLLRLYGRDGASSWVINYCGEGGREGQTTGLLARSPLEVGLLLKSLENSVQSNES